MAGKTLMTLSGKQQAFALNIAKLIEWAYSKGYRLTFGEAFRTQEQAEWNAKKRIGIRDSLHCYRLAVDFNLFKDGIFLTESPDYKPLGEYWESLSTPEVKCAWGGRFGDGNHFSVEDNGKK